jgi:hypothetical protein
MRAPRRSPGAGSEAWRAPRTWLAACGEAGVLLNLNETTPKSALVKSGAWAAPAPLPLTCLRKHGEQRAQAIDIKTQARTLRRLRGRVQRPRQRGRVQGAPPPRSGLPRRRPGPHQSETPTPAGLPRRWAPEAGETAARAALPASAVAPSAARAGAAVVSTRLGTGRASQASPSCDAGCGWMTLE